MNKSGGSHEQLMNKWWTSHEQVMNNEQVKNEWAMSSATHLEATCKLWTSMGGGVTCDMSPPPTLKFVWAALPPKDMQNPNASYP